MQLPSENELALAPAVKLEDGIDRSMVMTRDSTQESLVVREPTEKELCEIIIMIKDRLPNCNIAKVIELLHDTLIREQRPCFLLGEDDFYNDDEPEIEKRRMQMEYARKFEDSESDPRFYEER